jgi:nucleoside phosphorylase
MIAITFALQTESALVLPLLQRKRRKPCGDSVIIYGEFNYREIAIFYTGVGQKICEARIETFFRTEQPMFLISSGFAGAARLDLRVGDLFLAANFSDRRLLSVAEDVLASGNLHTANLFTATDVVDSRSERDGIVRRSGAAAVDMETEFIAHACAKRAVPLLSLRAISDTPNDPFPAPPRVLFDMERQKANLRGIAVYLLRRPKALGPILHFASQVDQAQGELGMAIRKLLKSDLLDRPIL